MIGLDYLKVSFLMMRAKPVRAALSLLGIYIGVLALVIILSIREGVRRQIDDLYGTRGAQVIFAHPGFDSTRRKIGRLGRDELELLKSMHGVTSVMPRVKVEIDAKTVTAASRLQVLGVDDVFVGIYRVPLIRGRAFLKQEVERKQAVCLLGVEAVRALFPSSEPIGSTVDLRGVPHTVIGVMQWTVSVARRASQEEVDMLIPIGRIPEAETSFIGLLEVRLDPRLTPDRALQLVKATLSRGNPQREAEFYVRSLEQSLEGSRKLNDRLLGALLGIAAISLLVGGIGIANVMVTSVTERTREIGLRKALGARRTDILSQFLVESSLLSGSGGLLAVVTGAIGVQAAQPLFAVNIPMAIPPLTLAGCVALTLLVGLLAGVYPASHAASLSPAEALRFE